MIIIADCGSTKCDWLLVRGGRDQKLENTVGFSPFFHSTAEIKSILETQLLPKLEPEEVSEVYFYGTGVHDEHRAEIVAAAIRAVFPNAQKVEVEHDLLAAARATCGHSVWRSARRQWGRHFDTIEGWQHRHDKPHANCIGFGNIRCRDC